MDSQNRSRRSFFIAAGLFFAFLFLLSRSETVRTPFRKPSFETYTSLSDLALPPHDRAYAAFLAAPVTDSDNDEDDVYYVGTRILAYQILHDPTTRTNDSIPFLVLVTDEVKQSKRDQLALDGATVIPVDRITFSWVNEGLRQVRWRDVLSKLHLWELTQYRRILFLDSDMILAGPIDGTFDDPAAQFRTNKGDADKVASDESPQPREYVFGSVSGQGIYNHTLPPHRGASLNAGFVVLSPSLEMYDHYLSVLAVEGKFNPRWPEQNLWNYVHRRDGNMPFGNIDPIWNVNRVTMRDVDFGIKSLHVKWWDTQEANEENDLELRDFVLSKKWMMEGSAEARKDWRELQ